MFRKYIVIPLCLFFSVLYAESYSGYRLDHGLLMDGGGYNFQAGSRRDTFAKSGKGDSTTWNVDWNLYLTGNYRTQKSRREESLESGYLSRGRVDLEVLVEKKWDGLDFSLLFSPILGGSEERVVEKTNRTLLDGEGILGIHWNDSRSFLQAGRGFQRLDRYGFFLNAPMNFLDLGHRMEFSWGWMSWGLLFGNHQPIAMGRGSARSREDLFLATGNYGRLSPANWNHGRRDILGGNWTGGLEFWEGKWNAFGYQVQRSKTNPRDREEFRFGEMFQYVGLEVTGAIIPKILCWEIGGIGFSGFKDRYIPAENNFRPKEFRNSNLYYGKIYSLQGDWRLELSGLTVTQDGFVNLESESQFMGGAGSVLLNRNDFSGFDGWEMPRYDAGGFFLGREWNLPTDFRLETGVFINQVSGIFGIGREAIFRLGVLPLKKEDMSFVYLSFAYAETTAPQNQRIFIEEWEGRAQKNNYRRIFLSAGLLF